MRGPWDTVIQLANARRAGYPTGRGRIALLKHCVRKIGAKCELARQRVIDPATQIPAGLTDPGYN